jgi:hypothetical protein
MLKAARLRSRTSVHRLVEVFNHKLRATNSAWKLSCGP